MVRPQIRKERTPKYARKLKKGQSIVTIGGIHGKISDVHESTITVIVDSNTKIKVDKSSVSMDSSTKLKLKITNSNKMIKVGLTGGIGSGKSTVSKILISKGFLSIILIIEPNG